MLHATMRFMPRLKLPDFRQLLVPRMSDLLPNASMPHHVKDELTDTTLDGICLHVDMCLACLPFATQVCLLVVTHVCIYNIASPMHV